MDLLVNNLGIFEAKGFEDIPDADWVRFFEVNEKEFFAHVRPTSLIGRFSSTQEVAAMVTYISSPLASSTTGAALRVDGGTVKSAF